LEKQIALIEVWLGKLPDYFKYHVETIRSVSCVDFYFFTNDKEYDFSKISHSNFHVNYINEEEFLDRFNRVSRVKVNKINHPKKIIDFKLSYFEMFSDYVKNYKYVGIYDIDTLFGDITQILNACIGEYDFISVGDEVFHNRLSGPLMIVRNTEEFRNLMKTDRYYETLIMDDIYGYGEQELSHIATSQYKTKILYSMNTETNNGGKNTYDVCWSGGKLMVNDTEKHLYHFIRKDHTIFQKVGNKIFGRYDKKFIDDFYWVFGFTENYSHTIPFLMDSINKYSNRKCIIYSINFDYNIPNKFLTSDQFIFKRIDIESGKKDSRGRDENIISCKPRLMVDVINFLPDKKFIFIDSDVYLTTASDDFASYFNQLENYPLINQHTHDRLYLCNIIEGENWTSTVDILAEAANVEVNVFPRRKTNVMLFDKNSEWFFKEQLQMYEEYKDSRPGIFTLHDEDSANVILSKYGLNKSLHLCDIEESSNINMSKFTDMNHPFHATELSEHLILPSHQNDVFCFHGLKYDWQYKNIQDDYGNSVIDCEEILVYYKDNSISFDKNSFLSTKKINENVDFIIKTIDGKVVESLTDQNLFQYWLFYISDIELTDRMYIVEIVKTNSRVKIYNNLLEIS
jgi:hypothetical protein